ncbi:MAG: protein translocase subunit SecF [Thermodesulfovibrionia bacterium]
MIEFFKKRPDIDFMGKRFISLAFSGLLVIIGFIAIIQVANGKANLGIDFAGGTAVQIRFDKPVPLNDIRGALIDAGVKDFDLQDLFTENKVLIRVKRGEERLGGISEGIVSALSKKFSDLHPVVDSTTEIGPKVGSRLRKDAMWAVLAAIIGILIYITVRFQFWFGVGATIATFHDVLAVLAVFYLLNKELNLIILSALLMIAGYSLTDTVVVFDRIRENLKKRTGSMLDTINLSINEVLSRTIITSLTTFFSAIALFFFGGEVIHDFALAIMLGIIIGTYSSIFVASPIVYIFGREKVLQKR